MDMDWTKDGKVSISMIKYLCQILDDFVQDIHKTSVTPAAEYLLKIRKTVDSAKLPEELAVIFHHAIAQLLFLSQRARRDVQTPVAFLTKRVKSPDKDDWNKLVRVLQYLKSTLHMKLTLEVDDLRTMNWFVDSAHQVHDDCKGHTGGSLTFGKGAVMSGSKGQKINTKSSSECELVGVDDFLPTILWAQYFMEEQGYEIKRNTIHQDNESTLRLLVNGKRSSTPRTKHIRAKYFLAKDKYDQGDIDFKKCHTSKMWVNMSTKPKQGTPFKVDTSMLMNVPVDYDDEIEPANTNPLLLPAQDNEPKSTIDQSKSVNSRRSVLGTSNNTRTATGFSSDPNSYKTNHNRIPVTKPSQVSWADRVHENHTKNDPLPDTTRRGKTGYFDTIGKYATNLVRLS